jgi:hypothetical protein
VAEEVDFKLTPHLLDGDELERVGDTTPAWFIKPIIPRRRLRRGQFRSTPW